MGRDIISNDRSEFTPDRSRSDSEERSTTTAPHLSRNRHSISERGYTYQISPAQLESMREIGRFRTVAIDDLGRHLYHDKTSQMRDDLHFLRDQGLVQLRTARTGGKGGKLPVVVLTKAGKDIASRETRESSAQQFYAGFVKPGEVAHDAAIYRMYHAEAARIQKAGGKIRRVILDYELKQRVYSPLAKAKALLPIEYAKKQAEIAKENGLTVVQGKIPLPDLRIEYETPTGELVHVNLELATEHYHGGALKVKAQAGFKMYAADGSESHLSRVLEERDIIAEILSL
jgi:hypothetical protein